MTRALPTPPEDAITVAVPPPTAVRVAVAPFACTATTWLPVLTHETYRPVSAFPDLSRTVAESVIVCPSGSVNEPPAARPVNTTDPTGTCTVPPPPGV